jgi:hypothetical protein
MKNLTSFFRNPFILVGVSFERRQRFSDDHIGRLTANNGGGAYTTMLTAMLAAHQAFFGQYTNVRIKDALKQQQTQLVDALIAVFMARVSRLNNLLIANEVNKTPVYQVFFPFGVTEFSRDTNKSNAESHMQRMYDAVNTHASIAGGAPAVAEFDQFRTDWADLRNLQLQLIGETESGRTVRESAEYEWADQVFNNLLTIANQFRNQPDMMDDFFNQSILRSTPNQPDVIKTGNVGNNMKLFINLNDVTGLNRNTNFRFEYPSEFPGSELRAQFANAPDAAIDEGRGFITFSNSTGPVNAEAEDFGYDLGNGYIYLMLYANDAQSGFKITIEQ